jgi:hypothetical protein
MRLGLQVRAVAAAVERDEIVEAEGCRIFLTMPPR